MTAARAEGPEPGELVRETGDTSATVRQLGGFILVAALILGLVRLLRGRRTPGQPVVPREPE